MSKVNSISKILCLILGIIMITMLFGCQNNAGTPVEDDGQSTSEAEVNEPSTEETEKTYKLGFNNYSDSHEFCYKVHEGIKNACDEYGVELLYAEGMMDAQKVVNNVDTFLLQGVDVIFEFNWMPEVGKQITETAKAQGVAMISGDVEYEGAYYFGVNNYGAGVVLGEFLGEEIENRWQGEVDSIVIVYYEAGGDALKQRMGGIVDGLKKKYPDFPEDKIKWFDNNGDAMRAQTIAMDYLTAHPDDSRIIFAANNDEGGVGTLAAVETANRQDDVLIVSHGADTPFRENIRAGKGDVWIGSVLYGPERYGSYLIPMVVDIIDGKDVPDKVHLEHLVITQNNIDEYYPDE
jgi:ribose transport system substrate-binding protein